MEEPSREIGGINRNIMEFKALELVRVASPPSRINRNIMEFKVDYVTKKEKTEEELIET